MQGHQARTTLDVRREAKQCGGCGQRFSPDATFCPFDGTKLERAAFNLTGDPLIGSTVEGRYEVLALLGEGGMGQVYDVRHVALDRHFAMKVLRRELARDEELAGRFIDEAKATASIRHPNVVQITDFGHLGDPAGTLPYFVMELLSGQTLGHVIKAGGPIPAARAVRILEQVAAALGAAHAAGVVHRDLKPENVFLVGGMTGGHASDNVRLVDFGAAKIVGSSRVTRQGIVFGTPHYMSPEQASGQPADHRADIYALGVIMYEMFTGRVPFEADTYMGVLTQHMFVQPSPPSQVSPAAKELGALEEITLICLAKKPEDRFPTMADLGAALAHALQPLSDGRMVVRPHVSRGSDPGSRRPPRYAMADELEPPSFAEMRGAVDRVQRPGYAVPWRWLLPLGALVVTALAAVASSLLLGRGSSAGSEGAIPSGVPATPAATDPAPSRTRDGRAFATAPSASTESAAETSATVPTPTAPSSSSSATAPSSGRRTPPPPAPPMDDVGDPFARPH